MKTILNSLKVLSLATVFFVLANTANAQTDPDTVCRGNNTKTYSVANTTGSTYAWTLSTALTTAGATITTGAGTNSITVNYNGVAANNYANGITVVETSNKGCIGDAQQMNVVVNPSPDVTLTAADNEVCYNETATVGLTVTLTVGTAPWSFTYTINGGAVQTQNVATGTTYTFPAPAAPAPGVTPAVYNYEITTVTATQNGSSGCVANLTGKTATVTVNPKPNTSVISHN